jgi:hypothetical protein
MTRLYSGGHPGISNLICLYLTCLDKIARENREPPAGTATTLISWEEQSVIFNNHLNLYNEKI